MNYMILHIFEVLLGNLNYEDVSSINTLPNIEDAIYNILKSESISDIG